ncbi:DUF402 domain-containing protein [Paractinoplanes durhamensis]|uniref:DUF402 domain-containing protein n=1 Tax=Paractinoplanes durhamensis TaxID=113563 RepID=A0ABQ3Z4C4_9ACTN|nr:DUF402 domain-containing protein [Actinoplanes durhamensis]GIE04394.1 hypothetical protein Adu01nite_57440 [Actinoplanes durhamensis]
MVEMRYTKWGGKRHWRFRAEVLGSDEFGWWYGCPAGTSMRRGFEEPILVHYDFIVLVPTEGRWIASWNGPTHEHLAIYVDVTSAPVRSGDLVEAVDLDLDVVRLRDGSVELLDEDEFEEHQLRYAYPPDVITQARATADDLINMITHHREPFGEVGDTWLAGFLASP